MGQQCAAKEKLEPASYVCEIARPPSVMADVLCIHRRRDNKMEDDTRLSPGLSLLTFSLCFAPSLVSQTCLQIKCFSLVSVSYAIKIGWKMLVA